MSYIAEPVTVRGSTPEELEIELAQFHHELRREFLKYHQREYKDHHSVAWLIRWLMSDDSRTKDTWSMIKYSRRCRATFI